MLPLIIFSQNDKHDPDNKTKKRKNIPVQSQFSDRFVIDKIYFNKTIDISGRGDTLEVELLLKNLTDDPIEMYIFIVALYETTKKDEKSFDKIVPQEKRIKIYTPYPGKADNFKYFLYDKDGKVRKNYFGKKLYTYYNYPRDFKIGVNQKTQKPYLLKEKIFIRTKHLSPYRAKYYYFNNAAVLIFNKKGEPVYRQIYSLDGYRR